MTRSQAVGARLAAPAIRSNERRGCSRTHRGRRARHSGQGGRAWPGAGRRGPIRLQHSHPLGSRRESSSSPADLCGCRRRSCPRSVRNPTRPNPVLSWPLVGPDRPARRFGGPAPPGWSTRRRSVCGLGLAGARGLEPRHARSAQRQSVPCAGQTATTRSRHAGPGGAGGSGRRRMIDRSPVHDARR